MRCIVLGAKRSGKSTILQQLACVDNPLQRAYVPTLEDTYQIQTGVDLNDRPREIVRIT
jgi:ABC-type lipoprotein export system ATPase subunit